MYRLRLLIALLFCGSALLLSAQGIDFSDDFSATLKAAKASGKPILLDAYATWCAPCRKMDEEIFSLPDVAEAVHLRYEPVRLDMEAAQNTAIAERYGIRAYPTLMVLDVDGSELDRSVGYIDQATFEIFVTRVREEPPSESFAAMDARFRAGTANRSTLENLVELGTKAFHPNTPEYVAALLDKREDWLSPDGMALAMQHVTFESRLLDSILQHESAYAKTLGGYVVSDRLARLLDAQLFGEETLKKKSAKKAIYRMYSGATADSTYIRYHMRAAREACKAKRFGKYAIKWQERYPSMDADELAELVYIFEARLAGWKTPTLKAWKAREEELRAASTFR